jgi:membrane protease YdiL (CAAX protease family)
LGINIQKTDIGQPKWHKTLTSLYTGWSVFTVFGVLFLSQAIWVVIYYWGPEHRGGKENLTVHFIEYGSYLIDFYAIWIFLLHRSRRRLSNLFSIDSELSSPEMTSKRFIGFILFGLLASILATIIGVIIFSVLWEGFGIELFRPKVPITICMASRIGWLMEAFATVLIAPVLEELYFRGILFRWLASRAGLLLGVVVSSIIFSAIHHNDGGFFSRALSGAVLAILVVKTGSLWPSIAVHAIGNGISFFLSSAEL